MQSSSNTSLSEEDKRAILKEKYLRFIAKLSETPANIEMCESTNVKVQSIIVQPNSENFIVSQLETPIGLLDNAVLRGSDIVKIKIETTKR
ncbi:unnamed protein product [Caenorhabditis bovis]|uniref:Gem-associated protein 7 n=1 Tax=Caenorhabditis bovis TaxID=2654633 RepID=A0A8S1EPB3_9PELO|nr:unnamed protein product [Caenorhabditis bovis]